MRYGVLLLATSTASDPSPAEDVSCGAACLYCLCHLEGIATSFGEFALSPREMEADLSFADLIRLAADRGLRLNAVDTQQSRRLPNRPFIAHLHRNAQQPIGHFVLLVPIDRKGRQYRLLDPPNGPQIVDESDFLNHRAFTGWVLVRRPIASLREIAGGALVTIGVAGICLALRKRLRARRLRQQSSAQLTLAAAESVAR